MATNPLMDGQIPRAGRVTTDMLHSLAASLNQCNFVRDSDRPYFVNKLPNGDGTFRHYLDR